MLKPRNIIIFIAVAIILALVYIFFVKSSGEETGLVSSSVNSTAPVSPESAPTEAMLGTQEFLTVLLNVKNIKLDDSIFSSIAFSSLRDSSIMLAPDGTEGRANPFAPIGADNINATPPTNTIVNTTTVTPPKPAGAGTPSATTTPKPGATTAPSVN